MIKKRIETILNEDSFLSEETLRNDNIVLLISLCLIIFAHSFIKLIAFDHLVLDTLLSLLVVSGLTSLNFNKKKFIRLSYFGLTSILFTWVNFFVDTLVTNFIAFVILVFFMIYITFSMILYVARTKEITAVLVLNAINSYLLIGLIGSFLFILTDVVYKYFLDISNGTINFGYTNNPLFFDYIYYSFITLTTVGYGEVTPAVPLTRSIAMFVSLAGQLYLTILVAMLVGKFLSKK